MCQIAALTREACAKPGIKKLYVALKTDVSTIGAATAHEVSTITMNGGATFYALEVMPDKTTYVDDGAGEHVWKKTLTTFIPMVTKENKAALNDMQSAEVIAIAQDTNGNNILLGDTTFPLKMKIKYDSKAIGGTDMPGAEITVEGFTLNLGYHFTGTIPV